MEEQKRIRLYICSGPHCSSRGSAVLLQQMEREVWERGLNAEIEVRSGGCQDHCDHGPNMLIWPGPVRYAHLNAEAIQRIVQQHFAGGEPVAELLATPEMRRSR